MSNSRLAYEPATRMTRDEYYAWAEQQATGRFERVNGVVIAMAPERANHNLIKAAVWQLLRSAVAAAGLPCQVFTDGMTIEIGDSDYEPDAVLRCGPKIPANSIVVPDPLVIVEVLSPSTSAIDRAWKLKEYFRVPTLRHYLIIWADMQQVAHHRRDDAGDIETQTVVAGKIMLDPPGIQIAISDIYAE